MRLLVSATGISPVAARLVMSSLLDPGRLRIDVPLVPSLPEGSDVAVAEVHATLGGRLAHHETRRGRRVAHRPRGIGLPRRCPPRAGSASRRLVRGRDTWGSPHERALLALTRWRRTCYAQTM